MTQIGALMLVKTSQLGLSANAAGCSLLVAEVRGHSGILASSIYSGMLNSLHYSGILANSKIFRKPRYSGMIATSGQVIRHPSPGFSGKYPNIQACLLSPDFATTLPNVFLLVPFLRRTSKTS